ncbi:hypothetical protein HMPREF9120_02534 [Neisseria sp. oral taxon 020 str. F0370]|nr:hypothetical protein HMPREF9120_02534 [Neisseria sp. oral taxon 020 str. F0370]
MLRSNARGFGFPILKIPSPSEKPKAAKRPSERENPFQTASNPLRPSETEMPTKLKYGSRIRPTTKKEPTCS